jgi:hypothetical protein
MGKLFRMFDTSAIKIIRQSLEKMYNHSKTQSPQKNASNISIHL